MNKLGNKADDELHRCIWYAFVESETNFILFRSERKINDSKMERQHEAFGGFVCYYVLRFNGEKWWQIVWKSMSAQERYVSNNGDGARTQRIYLLRNAYKMKYFWFHPFRFCLMRSCVICDVCSSDGFSRAQLLTFHSGMEKKNIYILGTFQ